MRITFSRLQGATTAAVFLLLAAGSVCSAATLEDTVLGQNPLIYWRLDEPNKANGQTAANLGSLGAAGDGTYVDSVANVTDSPVALGGNAAGFDAVGNDRVRLSAIGGFPSTAITATAFVRGSAAANSEATIFSYETAGTGNSFLLINQSNEWKLFIDNTNDGFDSTAISEADVLDDEWHHVAVTWDSTTGDAQFFLDGNLEDTINLEMGEMIIAGGTLVLAQEQDGLDAGFATQRLIGDIDEFALFNTVLTQQQIQAQIDAAAAVIPEPASIAIWSLLGIGLSVFGFRRPRKK